MLRGIRRQLPVHSPLTARSIATAASRSLAGQSPGPRLQRLLAHRFIADDVVLFDSGTQALTAAIDAALEAAGRDRPVALPGYTCYDVATAAIGADARIRLYDLDPDTLAPDWPSLERALEAGAGVVVLAPLYGYPFDWSIAEDLAGRHHAVLIEDAAQAAGGTWDGAPAGSLGAISTLSFGRGKGWTGGRGGALLLRRGAPVRPKPPARPPRGRTLSGPASVLAQWMLARPSTYGLPRALPWLHLGETRYWDPSPPAGMTRFSAALIMVTEPLAQAELTARRTAGSTLGRALGDVHALHPVRVPLEAEAGFLRVACRIPDAGARRRVLHQGGRLGIEPGYPTTLAELDAVRPRLVDAHVPPHALAGARALSTELVTLPCHGLTTPADRERVVQCLREGTL